MQQLPGLTPRQNTPLRAILLGLCIVLATIAASAHSDPTVDYANTFTQAEKLKVEAEIKDARFLAPALYRDGNTQLEKAQETYREKPGSKSIQKSLRKAISFFERAIQSSETAARQLEGVVAARQDAVAAQSIDYAPKEWSSATALLDQLTRRIAKNKTISAEKQQAAEVAFRNAELIAIKNNYLNATRDRIAQAQENRAKKYAPTLLDRAEATLLEAERALNTDRYDTDKPRSLARQAKIDAGHANRIAKEAYSVKKGDRSYEELVLAAESPLYDIADTLDLSIALDEGSRRATSEIIEQIDFLKEDSLRLIASEEEILALRTEVNQLQSKLGSTSSELARQNAYRNKLKEAETIFKGEPARVFRQEGKVRISAYGFTFKEGGSELQASQTNLLKKIMQTIRLFPNSTITVEGHTDSFGSDEFNLKLSKERASSVGNYLKARQDKLGFRSISTAGFGETQPIANNETAAGRAKNRRIELIISDIN